MTTAASTPPKEHQLVWYIRSNGEARKGMVIKVGTPEDPWTVATIWFDHPDGTPGKVKHVHNVPRASDTVTTRCWRERQEGSS